MAAAGVRALNPDEEKEILRLEQVLSNIDRSMKSFLNSKKHMIILLFNMIDFQKDIKN